MVVHPHIAKLAVESHIDDLRRDARGSARSRRDKDAPRRRRLRNPVPRIARRLIAKPTI